MRREEIYQFTNRQRDKHGDRRGDTEQTDSDTKRLPFRLGQLEQLLDRALAGFASVLRADILERQRRAEAAEKTLARLLLGLGGGDGGSL